MKPTNQLEMNLYAEVLKVLLDAKLQKVFFHEKIFLLEFYINQKKIFLVFDLNPQAPGFYLIDKIPFALKKQTHPLSLFFNKYFLNQRLTDVSLDEKYDRVLHFIFGYENTWEIELRAFPHGQNLILKADGKKISFHKIKELSSAGGSFQPNSVRTPDTLVQEWLTQFEKKSSVPKSNKKDDLIKKKKKALESMENRISDDQVNFLSEVGQFLVQNQTLDVPKKYEDFIDKSASLSKNILTIFNKVKELKVKKEHNKKRIELLKKEIESLEEGENPEDLLKTPNKAILSDWRGHRFDLDANLILVVGRNASDNLKILRNAAPTDIWLHLKDYPGAHGIIKKPKALVLNRNILEKAAVFVAKNSKKSNTLLKNGDTFEIVVAECRFVKPIKGDKLGRVRYSNEKVYLFRL